MLNPPCRRPRTPGSAGCALCGTFPVWARGRQNGVGDVCHASRARKAPLPSPQNLGRYLRLLGPSLAQVKDLPRIEIPEEGLDDLSALWGTGSQGVL